MQQTPLSLKHKLLSSTKIIGTHKASENHKFKAWKSSRKVNFKSFKTIHLWEKYQIKTIC